MMVKGRWNGFLNFYTYRAGSANGDEKFETLVIQIGHLNPADGLIISYGGPSQLNREQVIQLRDALSQVIEEMDKPTPEAPVREKSLLHRKKYPDPETP